MAWASPLNGIAVSGTVDVASIPDLTIASGIVDIGNTPDVTVANATLDVTGTVNLGAGATVAVSGTPDVNVTNATLDVTGSTIDVGTLPAVSIAPGQNVEIASGAVTVENTSGTIISQAPYAVGLGSAEFTPGTAEGSVTAGPETQPFALLKLVPYLTGTGAPPAGAVIAFQVKSEESGGANMDYSVNQTIAVPPGLYVGAGALPALYFPVFVPAGGSITIYYQSNVGGWATNSMAVGVMGFSDRPAPSLLRPDNRLRPQGMFAASATSGTLIAAPPATALWRLMPSRLWASQATTVVTGTVGGSVVELLDTRSGAVNQQWPDGLLLDQNTALTIATSSGFPVGVEYDLVL